jgi:hypothetical protein
MNHLPENPLLGKLEYLEVYQKMGFKAPSL